MIRPQPHPGEIDRSYFGAVRRMNGLPDDDSTVALMAEWAGVPKWSPKTVSVIELLSQVAGVSLESFVQQHSTLAFRRAITSRRPDVEHGSIDNRSLLSSSGMRRARSAAYFCVDCIHADQAELIRSSWRREHQMPGLYWCSKHRVGLSFTDAEDAFARSPSEFLDSPAVVDEKWVAGIRGSEPVLRYLDICDGLLDTTMPFTVAVVRDALRKRARIAGIRCTGRGQNSRRERNRELVSDRIQTLFPKAWLDLEFPVFVSKCAGQMLQSIDGVLWSGKEASSVGAYALVASVLFRTGDEAVTAFMAQKSMHRVAPQEPTSHRLRRLYVEGLGSYEAIGRKAGAASAALLRTLADLGLPDLGREPDGLLIAAKQFYVHGRSIRESAAVAGISHTAIETLVREAGLGLRTAVLEIEERLRQLSSMVS